MFIQGLDSFKSLSPEDRLLFDSIMAALARSVLLYHRQYLDGDLEEQSWDTYLQHVKPMMGAPGTHEWIEARGHHVFGSSFVTVESFVGSSDGREAYKHWRAGFVEDA